MNQPTEDQYKSGKARVYIAAGILISVIAITLIFTAFIFAADGSFDIGIFLFILALFLLVPYILFGRKIMNIQKEARE
jgi:hypothetical protein